MLEGEQLFVALNMMHQIGSEQTRWLHENGYLKDYHNTDKANQFINNFYQDYREAVLESLKKNNYQCYKVREELGFTEIITVQCIVDELEHEGLIEKGKAK